MPNMRHTPGPWQVAVRPEIDGELLPDGSGGCAYTGRMEYDRDLGVCTREDLEQGEYEPEPIARPWNEADAHLIAAAPDLLAALAGLVDAWDRTAIDGPPDPAVEARAAADLGDAIRAARAALTRAGHGEGGAR